MRFHFIMLRFSTWESMTLRIRQCIIWLISYDMSHMIWVISHGSYVRWLRISSIPGYSKYYQKKLWFLEYIENVYRCSSGLVMVWWFGWWLSRFTSDVLLNKIKLEKKIFLDRGATRYGSKNQPCSPKNRYFLIFWPYHVILHTLKPRNNQPEDIQVVKKITRYAPLLFRWY